MYLDLVKKCEDANSKSNTGDKTEVIGQKDGNYKRRERIYIDDQDTTNSLHSMEDILPQCTLDFHCSLEESNEGNISEKTRKDAVAGSPVFHRNNPNSKSSIVKGSNSLSSPSRSMIVDNNLNNYNEQENSDQIHSAISTSSTTNISSAILCSTPIKSKKWSRSKKQNVKKSVRSKIAMPLSSPKKKNNLISVRKQNMNKVPLQIINNMCSIPKNTYQMEKSNRNTAYNIQVTMSPSSRKLKQTKLVFHKTKKTMELSNNLKSTNISQATKTNKSISDQDKIFKQSTLTNTVNLEKRTNDRHIENTYNRVKVNESTTENNFVNVHTHAQIKDEEILQQDYEEINPTEVNDPLNTSNESDSTFCSEGEYNSNLNETCGRSFDSGRIHISPNKNESDSTNEPFKKGHIKTLETDKNNVEIFDVEETIGKKRLSTLEDENCSECERYGKKRCTYHRSTSYKRRNVPTNSRNTSLPDSPSSTT
ncbi:hypothetical protein KPH14_001434 [Odynerus spinipes]|uniref:Uncharacterized protein n=1 Tax=Odynerus spinipes TaxID=1348599 RepID=A0AAD9RUG2_9HYME|nr:hypothetical protein KPH14_001434 [Odynerus spinipes]